MSNPSKKRNPIWFLAGLVLFAAMVTRSANAQFDGAAITGWLSSISSFLTTYIGPVMNNMGKVESNINKYEQDVMYPVSAIQAAQASAYNVMNVINYGAGLFYMRFNTATPGMPSYTMQSQINGGVIGNINRFNSTFMQVYGSLPSTTQVSPATRQVIDMSDAQSEAAIAASIKLDAEANTEEQLIQQYAKTLSGTTGAAPSAVDMINAQIALSNVQAETYTQQGLAELLRTDAATTAAQNYTVKASVSGNTNFVNGMSGLIR